MIKVTRLLFFACVIFCLSMVNSLAGEMTNYSADQFIKIKYAQISERIFFANKSNISLINLILDKPSNISINTYNVTKLDLLSQSARPFSIPKSIYREPSINYLQFPNGDSNDRIVFADYIIGMVTGGLLGIAYAAVSDDKDVVGYMAQGVAAGLFVIVMFDWAN